MAEKRGRQPGFRMSNAHRVKIQNSNVLNALIEHANGEREMTATQVTAGLGLLRKCLPDLSTVTLQGDEENPITIDVRGDVERFTSAIAGLAARSGTDETPGDA